MIIPCGYHSLERGVIASVVTFVEMTEWPDWINREFPGELSAMPLDELDLYLDLFHRVGENWLWFSRAKSSLEELRARLTRPGYQVLKFNDGAGLVEMDVTGIGEWEISLFGLVESATGLGMGRAMMAHALRLAWSSRTRRVWLHTCTLDDPRALGFYQKMGFRPYARGIEVAADPRLHGILPETAAPQVPLLR